jgi:ABC-type Fe3+-siderophore transport system permease subunit
MTLPGADPGPSPSPEQSAETGTLAASLALKQRAGGIVVPILTVLFALLMSFIVLAATQRSFHTAALAFKEIFEGTGFNWIFHPTTNLITSIAAYNRASTSSD